MAKRGRVGAETRNEEEEKRRPTRLKKYKYLLLVVCEDGMTEPYYLQGFEPHMPPESIYFRTVGTGRSTLGVVNQAIDERLKLATEAGRTVDETWVLFDKDDADLVPANALRFADAFERAGAENIKVAYSNEAFELWLLLHLEDVDPSFPIPRADLYRRLERVIRQFPGKEHYQYVHGAIEVIDILREIGDEPDAIRRAEHLKAHHSGKPPITANPNTLVCDLVQSLNAWIAYFGFKA